jgi:sec-independent protein translocase protein TatA
MPFGLTPAHLIIILVIVLIVVGPGKLPDTGAAIGKALRGFKNEMDGTNPDQAAASLPPAPPVQQVQPPVQYVQVQPPVQYVPVQPQVQYSGLPAARARRAVRSRSRSAGDARAAVDAADRAAKPGLRFKAAEPLPRHQSR